jgi:hypothetical protein
MSWSTYFAAEVKEILCYKYRVPEALCNIIASFVIGIKYIQEEVEIIHAFKDCLSSMILRAQGSRFVCCRDFFWVGVFRVVQAGYCSEYFKNDCLTCGETLTFNTFTEEDTLWNLKLKNNMYDLLFLANSSSDYDAVVLNEIKIAMLSGAPIVKHFNHNLSQLAQIKNYHAWNNHDKYKYGYFGTPTAVILLQHIDEVDEELITQGYKFGMEYRHSNRHTLWRNRILSRHSSQPNQVVLHLVPYAQFSSLVAVNELVKVACQKK